MGGSFWAGMEGTQPEITVGQGNPEALKYGEMWKHPEYRKVAPGEQIAQIFMTHVRPRSNAHVIDFGCGTGRGALMLAILGGCRVTMLDFVNNALDDDIRDMLVTQAHKLRFMKADLEQKIPIAAEYGYCTDVMEHIPPANVDRVLDNILRAAQHVFFSISTTHDSCGKLIGEDLHLTVEPYAWWLQKFNERGCLVHWSQDMADYGAAMFYVSAWVKGDDITTAGVLNIDEEQVKQNVAYNIAQGWEQVGPHATNDIEVMIVGGGPTLDQYEDDIRRHRANGVKLITLNGAYNWALAKGLTPSAQIIVDARPFNARFVEPIVPDCKYMISSQCDPSVFANLPKDRTLIWHTSTEHIKEILNKQYELWFSVPGGSTVLLRAIPLLRMLGFRRFHLYGCDSCLMNGVHHTYPQTENDGQIVIPVVVTADGSVNPVTNGVQNGSVFYCHPWMISQANELMDLIRVLGDEIELEVYGDGLLAHILKLGAAADDEIPEEASTAHRGDGMTPN